MAVKSDMTNSMAKVLFHTAAKAVLKIQNSPQKEAFGFNVAEKAYSALGKAFSASDKTRAVQTDGFYNMEVQYNPGSLQFFTSAGTFTSQGPGDIGAEQYTQMTVQGNTRLSVQLIFEEIQLQHSVQSQIERILSLLEKASARQVIFSWGTMSFRGEITGADAKYTMFNRSGEPVRGEIALTIRQEEAGSGAAEMQYWDKAFDKLFGA